MSEEVSLLVIIIHHIIWKFQFCSMKKRKRDNLKNASVNYYFLKSPEKNVWRKKEGKSEKS